MQTVLENTTTNGLIEGLPSRVHEVYARFVQETPEHPAFVEAGRRGATGNSRRPSRPPPAICAKCKVRPGDRVMVASENSVALGAILFATGKLDAWAIAVNPRLSARELEQIRSHSGARLVHLQFGACRKRPPIMPRAQARPYVDRAVRRLGRRAVERGRAGRACRDDAARQVAALMYTSGTTGRRRA